MSVRAVLEGEEKQDTVPYLAEVGKKILCPAGLMKKVFVFISTEDSCGTPPFKLAKYTVNKVHEGGACGEVCLGFRIPDLHRAALRIICKRRTTTMFTGATSSSSVLNGDATESLASGHRDCKED